jgi:hypothetical protein
MSTTPTPPPPVQPLTSHSTVSKKRGSDLMNGTNDVEEQSKKTKVTDMKIPDLPPPALPEQTNSTFIHENTRTLNKYKGRKEGTNIYAVLWGRDLETGVDRFIAEIFYDWSTVGLMVNGCSGAIYRGCGKNTKQNYNHLCKWIRKGLVNRSIYD